PPTWGAELIGEIRMALFASPSTAKKLGSQPVRPDRLKSVPFIMPAHLSNGQVTGHDSDCACPLPRGERVVGHEIQTTMLGLDVAAQSDQVIYCVARAAQAHVKAGTLVEVPVE